MLLKHLEIVDKEFIAEIELLKELDKSFREIAELAVKAGDSWKKEHFEALNQYATKVYRMLYEDKYRIKRIKSRFKKLNKLVERSFEESQEILILRKNVRTSRDFAKAKEIIDVFYSELRLLRQFVLKLPDNLLKGFDYYFKNEHGRISFKEEKLDEFAYAIKAYVSNSSIGMTMTKEAYNKFYNIIFKYAIEQAQEEKNKKIAASLVIKDRGQLDYDEDISFHRISWSLLPNVLRYGILSHYMHSSIFGVVSGGSSGGWNRADYPHAIATYSYYGYFKYKIDLYENPEKYARRIYEDYERIPAKHILRMNMAERRKHIYEIIQDKKRKDEYTHQIYDNILYNNTSFGSVICIFRTKEIPCQIGHADLAASGDYLPEEVHFRHRISPKQIIGVIMKVSGNQEQDLAILNTCKKYAKPPYDNHFRLLWPV